MSNAADYFRQAQEQLDQQQDSVAADDLQKVTAIKEAIKHLQDFQHPFAATELSPYQIMLFSKAQIEADYFGNDNINSILSGLAVMKMSTERKSRNELVDVLKGMFQKKGGKMQRIKEAWTGGQNEQ